MHTLLVLAHSATPLSRDARAVPPPYTKSDEQQQVEAGRRRDCEEHAHIWWWIKVAQERKGVVQGKRAEDGGHEHLLCLARIRDDPPKGREMRGAAHDPWPCSICFDESRQASCTPLARLLIPVLAADLGSTLGIEVLRRANACTVDTCASAAAVVVFMAVAGPCDEPTC